MKTLLKRLMREDEGQDLIEYALLAALIAVVCTAAMETLQGGISGKFEEVAGKLGVAP
jgi:pilus assembly protein Flp/PilA